MNIHIIYFDQETEQLAFDLRAALDKNRESITIASGGEGNSLPCIPAALWVTGHFRPGEALLFICSAAQATRSIAGHVREDEEKPAVLVLDAKENIVLPLLTSGIGETNRLVREIAEITGGKAVLTEPE